MENRLLPGGTSELRLGSECDSRQILGLHTRPLYGFGRDAMQQESQQGAHNQRPLCDGSGLFQEGEGRQTLLASGHQPPESRDRRIRLDNVNSPLALVSFVPAIFHVLSLARSVSCLESFMLSPLPG